MIFKLFTLQRNHKWIHNLDQIVDDYNNRYHSTIRMKPVEVNSQNESTIFNEVYRKKQRLCEKTRFKLNDYVRVAVKKNIFGKGYTRNWSTEIFQIYAINRIFPEQYYLKDRNGVKINGAYYSHELSHVHHKDRYLIEKVMKRDGDKVLVKFLGLNSDDNKWINDDEAL
jgi:hypothetical protein